ncbi:Crp/Fnr family transcriptional regulator [Compostibacter hankyongensis]|uniref:Cyclic nucleotide-binding domain-containing protein n=1 Tax=Compostibacter hankyongensis TaxID=1007089 RepID=A0ABP8G6Z7_9BACT
MPHQIALTDHIRRYIDLREEEIAPLLSYFKPLIIKRKTNILEEGKICKTNYFIASGCLRMFFVNRKGAEQITQLAIEGWWLSDYMSLSRQTPSSFYIQAVENCRLMALDQSSEKALLKAFPGMEHYFRVVMQQAYAAAQMRIRYLYDFSREELYRHFSMQFPEFLQRIPQYMLASFLGFTPEYLSEIRKKEAESR